MGKVKGNPFQDFDVTKFDGKEIRPGIFIMGDIWFDFDLQAWCALSNCLGALAIIELKVTMEIEEK